MFQTLFWSNSSADFAGASSAPKARAPSEAIAQKIISPTKVRAQFIVNLISTIV